MEVLSKKLKTVRPDFILALDAKGLDFRPVVDARIARVAWFVDNPAYFDEKNALTSDDIILVWDNDYIADLKAAGFNHVHFLPLATNPQRFNPHALLPDEKRTYACEVSFVGTIGKTAHELAEERSRTYPREINLFVDKMIELTLYLYDSRVYHNALTGMRLTEHNLDMKVRGLVQFLVDIEVNAMKRHSLANDLVDYDSIIYSDLSITDTPEKRVRFAPTVDYRTELVKVFKASTININLTRPQLRTTVNQRVFDVFACGGFLLTDYRRYLDDILPFAAERITFSNPQDLKDKIDYYLKHTSEREELAVAARGAVCRNHTYLHRMEELLKIVGSILQN